MSERSKKSSQEESLRQTAVGWHLDLGLSSLQNHEKMHFCCLSHPVFVMGGILLWQPQQTNICVIWQMSAWQIWLHWILIAFFTIGIEWTRKQTRAVSHLLKVFSAGERQNQDLNPDNMTLKPAFLTPNGWILWGSPSLGSVGKN